MNNPFQISKYTDLEDDQLLDASLSGNKEALNELIKRHQPFIYNVAWKMVHDPNDAWDLTQEALVKVITKLSSFRRESSFRTWLYRITFNHFLNTQRKAREDRISSFDDHNNARALGLEWEEEVSDEEYYQLEEQIVELRTRCMSAMLLCLTRDQRLIYIIGDLFEGDHNLGAEIMDITPANFRVKLHRARKDLYNFMQNSCGLINKNNPCRCRKQTKFALSNGILKDGVLDFNLEGDLKINQIIEQTSEEFDHFWEEKYNDLFQDHSFKTKFEKDNAIKELLADENLKKIFPDFYNPN